MRDQQEEPLTEESFTELYIRFRHLIFNVARRFFPRSPAEAEEIAQEAFARAWQYRHTYRSGKNAFRNWLWMITQNVALGRLNRPSHKREIAWEETTLLELVVDSAPEPDDVVIRRQLLARLEKVLDKLPPDDRFLLFLRHDQGFSFDQLARFFRRDRHAVARNYQVILKRITQRLLWAPASR